MFSRHAENSCIRHFPSLRSLRAFSSDPRSRAESFAIKKTLFGEAFVATLRASERFLLASRGDSRTEIQ